MPLGVYLETQPICNPGGGDDFNATEDHPHDSVISYITTPRVPEDLACLRFCLFKDVLTKEDNIFFNAVIVSHRWPLKNVIIVVV